jgi:hypothetical protein
VKHNLISTICCGGHQSGVAQQGISKLTQKIENKAKLH